MQQYFAIKKDNNILYINKNDIYHIKNVMRMNENDKLILVYDDISYLSTLSKDYKTASIIEVFKKEDVSGTITAFVPILNDEKLSFIFQKGTELGINKFIIVEFERCKFKFKEDVKIKKLERYNKITKEAAEQSRRLNIPIVEDIINFKNIDKQKSVNILCSLDNANVKRIDEVLNTFNVYDNINIVFGPEGGLTKEEEKILVDKGFIKTSLGSNVLRSETVILYVASVIGYLKLGGKK
jgi:16S rRNA (uracil1498-N3)-methyltransferase